MNFSFWRRDMKTYIKTVLMGVDKENPRLEMEISEYLEH